MLEEATRLRMHLVNIVCDDGPEDDAASMSFLAIVSSIPRIGEIVELQDDKRCKVYNVLHRAVPRKGGDGKIIAVMLVPTVAARQIN